MKPSNAYFHLCRIAFFVACGLGGSYAMSYMTLAPPHDWLTWRPAIGIALLYASMLLSFIGYARCVRHDAKKPQSPNNALQPTQADGDSVSIE